MNVSTLSALNHQVGTQNTQRIAAAAVSQASAQPEVRLSLPTGLVANIEITPCRGTMRCTRGEMGRQESPHMVAAVCMLKTQGVELVTTCRRG